MPSKRFVTGFYLFIALLAGAVMVSHVVVSRSEAREDERRARVLSTRIPTFRAIGLPFDQAVQQLAGASGCAIAFDRDGLIRAGFPPKTPVSLVLSDATVEQILDALVGPVITAESADLLRYRWNEAGTIDLYPASLGVPTGDAECRAYDLRDLLGAFPPPEEPLADPATFGGGGHFVPIEDAPPRKKFIWDLRQCMGLSENDDHWIERGADAGTDQIIDGRLIIRQSHRSHAATARMLAELRTRPALP